MLISDLKSKQNNINNELRHAINIIKKRDIKLKKNCESEESDFNESEEELIEDIKKFSDELMKKYNFDDYDTRKKGDTRKKEDTRKKNQILTKIV